MRENKKLFVGFYLTIIAFFLVFLGYPLFRLITFSFMTPDGFSLKYFAEVFKNPELGISMQHSLLVALSSAMISTALAFLMSFTLNFTTGPRFLKKILESMSNFPMFLPTLAYGFTIIYAFGNQGFISRFLGTSLINAYGFQGLLLGFVIYTFPIAFILINNTMKYIDARLFLVSKLMGDSALRRFTTCLLRPMLATIALSVIQSFFLAFTDFGLPSALAGNYPMMSSMLYTKMQGALLNFGQGTVVAILMLAPTIFTTILMLVLQKYQVRGKVQERFIAFAGKTTDRILNFFCSLLLILMLIVFVPIFIVPFVEDYPYKFNLSLANFTSAFEQSEILQTYQTSVILALLTAIAGCIIFFFSAYLTSRSPIADKITGTLDFLSNLVNAIPGMVLGVAFLITFSGTSLQSTFTILLIVNLVHFFSTPFQMANQSLTKLSKHYETTGMLLGDNFFKTLFRVILPNMRHTIFEMISYLFIQSMVTISAIIFLVDIDTATITTKIQSLQNFNKFSEVFVLSLLLFATNLIAKIIFHFLGNFKFSKTSNKSLEVNSALTFEDSLESATLK